MKPKTMIPLVLGVLVGGAAIKMVVDVVSDAQAAGRSDISACVVAKVDIQFAEEITPDKLQLVEWPKSSLPESHFSSIESLAGRVSDMLIPKDVPVYGTMLAPIGTPPGIQVRIRPGYRAVAVPIDEVSGVSYQVKPGDRVDIVALVKVRANSGGTQQMSRIILQNIEVATVGRALHTNKKGEAVKSVARSVTLLLTPEEVTRLHMAQSMGGRLSLALRGNLDVEEDLTDGSTAETLSGDPSPVEVARTDNRPKTPVTPPWNVKVIQGNQIENIDYRWQDGQWRSRQEDSQDRSLLAPPALESRPGTIPPSGVMENNRGRDDFDSAQNGGRAEES